MNTSIQHPGPNGIVQPSGDSSRNEAALSAWRKLPGRFTFAALLAGLLLLLFSVPAARAQGIPPGCTGSGIGITLFTSAPDVHVGDTICYGVLVFNGTGVGPIVCDASNIVAFIVTPDGVSHPVTLVHTYLLNGQSDYYPSYVCYVVRQQDIRSDGSVRATASDTATIYQNDTPSQGGANQGVNTEVSQPCIQIAAQCVSSVGENGLITFTGTVTNCGNNTLVGVTVTNFVNGGYFPVAFITSLATNQIASFSGSWIPLNPCSPSTATFTAQGTDQYTTFPRTVTSSASTTCSEGLTPGIKVTKSCPAQPVAPGQLLTFSGSVSNTGNVTLTGIVVVNNQPVANTTVFTLASLAPGAVANFTGSYVAPTNCSVADTLTAIAVSSCGVAVTNSASANCPILTTPQITVTVACPVAPVVPGGLLTYSGTVQNTGNITLTNVVVVSDRPVANTVVFTRATLAPGVSTNFTAGPYTVPANACAVTTTFSGTGKDICTLNAVTNSVSPTCTVITTPAIGVTLACPVAPATAGGLITYTGFVTNSGNVTLNNVTVVDNQASPSTVLTVASLAPHASANFTASFIALTGVCSVSSTVTATGSDNCTQLMVTNSASATCTLITTPGIAVTQVCPVSPAIPGGLLTYSGSVSNAGTVTLTNVVVLNNLSGATPVFTVATLAPGAFANFTGSYVVPANCSSTSTSTATGRSLCGVAVTNTASTTCPITTTPLLAVTQNCPVNPAIPGGLLTYIGSVSNAGNIMLTNVVVLNNLSGATPVFTTATLAPGAFANFTGSYVAPTNCSSTSTSTATGRSLCGVAVTNTASTTCPITTAPAIVVTQVCPVSPAIPGGLLTYSGSVSNAGNVTLTNVVVLNNLSGATPVFTAATLAPRAVSNFTGSYVAPANCSSTSTSTATGWSLCGVAVTNTASTTCPITTAPAIAVTQVCPVSPAIPGGLLTYSGSVSNAGNITLTNVVVLNNLSGATPVFTVATLAPGAFANFTGSYVVPTNCSSTSTSTATGRSLCGVAVTNSASANCPILTAPQIAVTAACPVAPVVPGGSLTYSGTVQNTGNITLTNVVVVSDRPVANTVVFTRATLAPGVSTNFTAGPYTVPANACAVTTTFSGTGKDTCTLNAVTNSVSPTCTVITTPAIGVTLACSVAPAIAGGLITYTGFVTNSGNVILNNVTVVDNQASPSTVLTVASLAPHASANFTASFTTPTDTCSVSSTVTATGSDNCTQAMVTSTASATCTLITTPAIAVTQVCPASPAIPGGLLTYSGSVSNAGNITLTNVVVLNNLSGATPVFTAATLAPGAVTNFTGSYVAPTNCSSTSISTATGRSLCGVAVTNTASTTCPITTTPAIVVTQTCPTTPVGQGDLLTYSGTVRNAGNVTLTNIVVVNNWPYSNVIFTAASLAPGATANFTGSYVVPGNCCQAWIWVEASGQGCAGATVSDTDSGTCTVLTSPQIVVTKVCDPKRRLLRPGDRLTYSGSVSNAGNITLINVTVVDNQPVPGSPLLTINFLAPGESQTYTGSYTVPPDFCGDDTVTASGFDSCSYALVTSSATATCPIAPYSPRIAITKNCPPLPTRHGGQVIYSGTVSNAGNVTLINVFVVDDQPSNNTPVIGPITLSPGAVFNFSGQYTAPLVCCETTDTVTARGQDRCSGSNVTATATTICPTLYTPGIALVQNCPPYPIPMGSLYVFSGFVTNTGDAILMNVVVFGSQAGTNLTLLGPLDLAPGQSEQYTGSLTVPFNICAVTVTVTSQETCKGTWITNTVSCPVATTPGITITESCPPGPVTNGSSVAFGGLVCNSGNITLMNIFVFSGQPSNTLVLGPITLAPGACAPFAGSYLATGGCNPLTNSIIVTNSRVIITPTNMVTVTTNNPGTITTNTVTPMFGTIDPVSAALTGRFSVPGNLHGFMYADQDENWGPTLFYAIQQPASGADTFDTISTISAPAYAGSQYAGFVTNEYNLTLTGYDALTLAAPDVGYGAVNFYYLRHDNSGVAHFGVIKAAGASSDSDLPAPLAATGYTGLAFAAADVGGYGANMFYYVRNDATGLSWFGTINPTPGLVATDRYTVGTNFDALVFVPSAVSTWGTAIFAYLRHDNTGSIIGTIDPVTHVPTDRLHLGTNLLTGFTFTATDVGYGANLFYYLRPAGTTLTTNTVTTYTTNTVPGFITNTVSTYTTNSVVSFTPTNTVTASGMDICQVPVTAAANCGCVASAPPVLIIGTPNVNSNGLFSLSFPTEVGKSYTVQYKDALTDPAWTDLVPPGSVPGTGGLLTIYDPSPAALHPTRFYRIMSMP